MTTTLYLIRHGVTLCNKRKQYCGRLDVPLSIDGKKQAARLHARLRGVHFDAVYTSNLKRAKQTAAIVFKEKKLIVVPDLREINFGIFEGKRYQEIVKKYPEAYEKWVADPFKYEIPRGENLTGFRKRVNTAIKKIAASNRGKTVALVCHGGTISIFLTGLMKSRKFWEYIPESVGMSIVEFEKGKHSIKLLNCTKHLTD